MRDDVAILLNEREPFKQQMATELEQHLNTRRLSVERLKPCSDIAEIILQRNPRVLILDYLLGNFGTALDVLQHLSSSTRSQPIYTILWTDEGSIHVAVSALKLGANDYIDIGSSQPLNKVLNSISEGIKETRPHGRKKLPTNFRKSESLIFHDPCARHIPSRVLSLIAQNQAITVLLGETGAGRNALANFFHESRPAAGSFTTLDLDTWLGTLPELFGKLGHEHKTPLLSAAATVMIDHVEYDSGELLEATEFYLPRIWSNSNERTRPSLIVGTNSPDTAKAWAMLPQVECIEIPPLRERKEDFLPLIQGFIAQASTFSKPNSFELSPEFLNLLTTLEWTGNIRQFRAAIMEALLTPLEVLRTFDSSVQKDEEETESGSLEKLEPDHQLLLRSIRAARLRWTRYHSTESSPPSSFAAHRALNKAYGNVRVAAANLGVGIPQLRKALGVVCERPFDTTLEMQNTQRD